MGLQGKNLGLWDYTLYGPRKWRNSANWRSIWSPDVTACRLGCFSMMQLCIDCWGNTEEISVRVHSPDCKTEPTQAGQVEHEEKFSCVFLCKIGIL